jgi:acyl-CoA synthetase (AMP-forming)/AMP-acid ligase II
MPAALKRLGPALIAPQHAAAHHLTLPPALRHSLLVQRGDVVAIHMPNCPEYIIAFQAIASIGAINTTSNPLYTTTELLYQLHDSGAKYVITIPQLLDTVKTAAAGVPSETTGVRDIFVLGEASGAFLTQAAPQAKLEVESVDPKEQLLVLPYSSGTTGMPKGVMLSHYNVIANVEQCTAVDTLSVGMKQDDVVMGVLPCYHIYGMTVVMATALRKGCTLVMLPKFDPQLFLTVIAKYKVSYAPLVPPIINFLARHPAVASVDTSSLKLIFSGAAALDAETQKLAETRLKGAQVRQGYGMTEMSPVSHIADPLNPVAGSIGIPVPNTVCKIVDVDTGKELPPGPENTGELCVKGPQVMKGYLNNADATAKTILNGYCHTGDIAWRDEKGNTFIVDRLKELIK